MRILLIEDTEFISFLYKRQLEKAGLTTEICATGKDCLETIFNASYDLIMLDMLLPDMNGIDILKKIRADQKTKDTPVLLLSNVGQDDTIEEAYKLGISGYLIKDHFSPKDIVTEVKKVLETSSIKHTS